MRLNKAQSIESQYFGWTYIVGFLMWLLCLTNYLVLWLQLLLLVPLLCLLVVSLYAAVRKKNELKKGTGPGQWHGFRLCPNPLAFLTIIFIPCCCVGLLTAKAAWLKGLFAGALLTCILLWQLTHTPEYAVLHAKSDQKNSIKI